MAGVVSALWFLLCALVGVYRQAGTLLVQLDWQPGRQDSPVEELTQAWLVLSYQISLMWSLIFLISTCHGTQLRNPFNKSQVRN